MMDEQQLNGGIDEGAGKLREAAGALLGDLKLQAQGRAQQVRGQAESLYGDAREKITELTAERPATALAAALAIGVVIGMLLAR